ATAVTNPFDLGDVGYHPSLSLVDLDGDGDLDLVVGNSTGDLLFFENTGTASSATFGNAQTAAFGLDHDSRLYDSAFADLDGDGLVDALGVNGSGDLMYFHNTGTATRPEFADPSQSPFGLDVTTFQSPRIEFADIDGDGKLDLFAGTAYSGIWLLENTGSVNTPAFASAASAPGGLDETGYMASPTFADIDADGDLDALVGNYDGNLMLFWNNHAPIITSDGGSKDAKHSIEENTTSITVIVATDLDDPPEALSYRISGGADQDLLTIDPDTGRLSFVTAPDFESPRDSDANNRYEIEIKVDDGKNGTATQRLTIIVTDITEGGSGGDGGGSAPESANDGDDDIFVGDDSAILDDGSIDTGLNPTDDFTDTTLDGAPVTTGTTTDRRTGEDVAVVVSDPTAPGERTDVDPSSPEVDIPVGGVKVSKPESLGLIATSRVSTERTALETLTGGDDAATDPEEAAGRAALIDALESRAAGGGVEVVQVTPVWPSEGDTGDTPLRLTIDLGDGSSTDGRPTLVVVDTNALYDAAGNPRGPVEIVVAGAGTLVVRGPGSFRGDDGDTGPDVDIVQGDGSAQVLFFGPDDDIIRGGGGDDTLGSAGGHDRLFGDGGNDRLDGGPGADILIGGRGDDRLVGGSGADTTQVAGSMTELTLTRAADGTATLVSASGTDTLGADVELLVSTADGALTLVQTFSAARHPGLGIDTTFDADFYLAANPDVAAAVAAGIIATAEAHFLTWGAAEGRAPNTGWDEAAYLAGNPDIAAAVATGQIASGIAHVLRNPSQDLVLAADTTFDTTFYLANNPDVAAAIATGRLSSAEAHFLGWGMAEGRAPHALWNAEDYLVDNPDVAAAIAAGAFSSAVEHYWCYGAAENREPGPWFDTAAYLAANPDVAAAGIDAASHFVLWGAGEGRLGAVADTELLLA
ncbi:FG-GAP-like repeat-containing protein, partial [Marichromatium bheemlicum]